MLIDSRVEGRVVVSAGARLERTIVRGPAVIGSDARVADAYIGPYTAIGAGCEVVGSEVEHSILLRGSKVRDLGSRMEASLLGRDSTIRRGAGLPKTIRMMLGDRSELTLP